MNPATAPDGRARLRALRHAAGQRQEAIALALAALLLAITFLRPSVSLPLPQVDAVVVFDVTQSMNVVDAGSPGQPLARLAHAKAEFGRLLALLPCGSSLGWGIFTEHRSFLLLEPVEVCEHSRELADSLAHIDGGMAWAGNSEVAKALNSGMRLVDTLAHKPALVFVSDGHEAPPLSPNYRPAFTLERGKVRGLVLGVGDELPRPIPKRDPSGRAMGVWQAGEVMQVDPRSLGRAGNRESMVDSAPAAAAPPLGGTPGSEHLSSLREAYLKLLASEAGLQYERLSDAHALRAALTDARLASTITAPTDLRPAFAGLALLALLWSSMPPARRRRAQAKGVRALPASRAQSGIPENSAPAWPRGRVSR